MAVTPFKTFSPGEILTASDLNSSFTRITDNGEDLGWPATKAKDLNGQEFILDGDGDTSFTADTDDQIDIKIAGADDFQFTANTFTALSGSKFIGLVEGNNANAAAILNEAASDTNPTIVPDKTDSDTGIGGDGANGLSVVTGGSQALDIDSSQKVTAKADFSLSIGSIFNIGGVVDQTISSGAITYAQTNTRVDTEGAAATDDLDTITGGAQGDLILITTLNDARDITIRSGVGNIFTKDGTNRTLDTTTRTFLAVRDPNGNWIEW